jgi:splicing factor U2AF 35 kDa subunit
LFIGNRSFESETLFCNEPINFVSQRRAFLVYWYIIKNVNFRTRIYNIRLRHKTAIAKRGKGRNGKGGNNGAPQTMHASLQNSIFYTVQVFLSSMYRGRDQGPRGGAEHLARIHGTEEDKVNCPFYFKIGACRHGDKCSRQHHKPQFSVSVIVRHMWNNPMCAIASAGGNINLIDKAKYHDALDDFYEEIFEEFRNYGELEDIQVCENLGDHMVGNVYIKYYDEDDAQMALEGLNGRFYAGRRLTCEFSPVTDFREARCRQFDEGTCTRGPYCNFMHVCEPSTALRKYLEKVLFVL